MGIVTSRISRHLQRFNVESRTEKILSREKPEPAPRHPSAEKYLPDPSFDQEIKDSLLRKDPQLDQYLKKVYISSYDSPTKKNPKFNKPSERNRLPVFRGIVENFDLGYKEPDLIPHGKLTLRQVMTMLSECQQNPEFNNANAISTKYHLDSTNAEHLIKYFSSLKVEIRNHNRIPLENNQANPEQIPGPTIAKIEEGDIKK